MRGLSADLVGIAKGSAADLLSHHVNDALEGGGEDHVDDELKDEIQAGQTDEDEMNGRLSVAHGVGKGRDGVEDHKAARHEHARVDNGGDGGGEEHGQKLVLFGEQLVDQACQIARQGGLHQTDARGDDGILLEQEGGEGIQTHNAALDVDLQTEHEAQESARGGAQDHGAQSDGDQHQTDGGSQHGDLDDDACRLGEYWALSCSNQ